MVRLLRHRHTKESATDRLNPLSSKLAFRHPTWTASCRCRAVATNPQNSWKARRIRFQRFQYPRIVRGRSRAEFGQHRRPLGTCFSRGHVASMESVTYTARNTRFTANLDSSGWDLSVADPFVSRCLSSPALLPFPHPAHRTGRADLPHPALGEDSHNRRSHCM